MSQSLSPIYIDSKVGSGPTVKHVYTSSGHHKSKRYKGLLEYLPLNLCSDCLSPCNWTGNPSTSNRGDWRCVSSPQSHTPLCQLTSLDSADAYFFGNGPTSPISIGIEVKSVDDLISSLINGRLIDEQIPKMVSCYDIQWLMVYGEMKGDPKTGNLQVYRNRVIGEGKSHRVVSGWVDYSMTDNDKSKDKGGGGRSVHKRPYSYIQSRLITISELGVKFILLPSIDDVCHWIYVLYKWWNKPFADHDSHLLVENKVLTPSLMCPSQEVKDKLAFAYKLPGLGLTRAMSAIKHFPSIYDMIIASEEEWLKVEGIGKTTARAIVSFVRRGKETTQT
jgi:hypothetical protein